MEIDENLLHTPLPELDHCEQLAKRKGIYERLYPETRRGVAGGRASGETRRGEARTTDKMSFVQDTARQTGVSPRTVERDLAIAAKLDPAVKELIRGTPLADSKTGLLELAGRPEEEQKALVTAALAEPGGKAALTRERLHKLETSAGETANPAVAEDIAPAWEAVAREAQPFQNDAEIEIAAAIAEANRLRAEHSPRYRMVVSLQVMDGLAREEGWGGPSLDASYYLRSVYHQHHRFQEAKRGCWKAEWHLTPTPSVGFRMKVTHRRRPVRQVRPLC
jgi:hypothetical protein